jgi:hypothetical protein
VSNEHSSNSSPAADSNPHSPEGTIGCQLWQQINAPGFLIAMTMKSTYHQILQLQGMATEMLELRNH